jgi:hypothetical protein
MLTLGASRRNIFASILISAGETALRNGVESERLLREKVQEESPMATKKKAKKKKH